MENERSDTLNKAIAAESPQPGRASEPMVRSDALVLLATQQHGVFSLDQLDPIGIGARAVHKRASSGRIYRMHRGVYSIAPPALLTRRGHYMAAVLACGEGAVLSHRSAADLHELRATDRVRIDVIVPGRSRRTVKGVEVHRSTTLTPRDVTIVDRIPCTTVARTVLDLAGVISRRPLERAIEQAEIQEVLDGTALNDEIERNRTTRGATRLRAVLADLDRAAPTESALEELMYAALKGGGVPLPERQVYIDPGDGEPAVRVDFVWRAQRLIVETDGARYHRTSAKFESDRRKDQRLTLAGWRVLRITWRQLVDEPERIVETVRRMLEHA